MRASASDGANLCSFMPFVVVDTVRSSSESLAGVGCVLAVAPAAAEPPAGTAFSPSSSSLLSSNTGAGAVSGARG